MFLNRDNLDLLQLKIVKDACFSGSPQCTSRVPQCGEAGWISGAQLAVVALPTGSVPGNLPLHQIACDREVVMTVIIIIFDKSLLLNLK